MTDEQDLGKVKMELVYPNHNDVMPWEQWPKHQREQWHKAALEFIEFMDKHNRTAQHPIDLANHGDVNKWRKQEKLDE